MEKSSLKIVNVFFATKKLQYSNFNFPTIADMFNTPTK